MIRRTIGILTLYKLNIAKDIPATSKPTGEIVHTMYLIGDAGNAKKELCYLLGR